MKVLAVGSDPEFFIQDSAGNIIPSRGIIPGNKKKPRPLVWGAVHRDNVACELNPIPASSETEFSSNFLNLKNEVEDKLLYNKGMSLVVKTSHEFSHEQLNYREAQEFGCDEDFTIWEHIQPPVMRNPYSLVRSAGGHIHLAIEGLNQSNLATVISRLDMLISVPLVLLDPDKLRRQSYGKAGCYRPKPYGIEYRTPSNVWCGSDELRRWVYRQAVRAVEYDNFAVLSDTHNLLVGCINDSGTGHAQFLCDLFNLEVPL
jgi:hypothetical protein